MVNVQPHVESVLDSNLETTRDERPFGARHLLLYVALALVIILVLLVVHILVGTVDLTPTEVVKALLNQQTDEVHRQVVWGLRLPRALVAVLAGGMIGLSGAILQSITRNPLAEPGLLGVSAGGVLAVVALIVFSEGSEGGMVDSGLLLPLMAMIGGMLAGSLTYALSWKNGTDPVRLALGGVLVGSICGALTSVMLLWANEYQVMRIIHWTIGSTAGRVWAHWNTLWPVAIVGIPFALACAAFANVLQLGDDVARGLGTRLESTRMLLLFASVLLDAGAVAVVGPIGFIGLIGPHMARRLVGGDVRRLFPLSILLSAILLLASDILARTLTIGWIGPLMGLSIPDTVGLPVGAVTALLGVPFFLYLILRQK